MTNNRNASGAADPTAYIAMKNVTIERELKLRELLRIFAREQGFTIVKLKLMPRGEGV